MRVAVVTERTLSRARAGDEDAFRLLTHCHEPEGGVAGVDISCVSWCGRFCAQSSDRHAVHCSKRSRVRRVVASFGE
jgi:hypothetical protein